MSFLSDLGAPDVLGGIDSSGILQKVIIIGIIVVAVIGAGIFAFLYYSRKCKKNQFKHQVPIFMSMHGKLSRIGLDWAKELFVPDTNISLFFLKERKIYIARPTRAMGKNEFWYKILENGEWVNFDLSSPKDDNLTVANYDHRDTRYAYVNLKEIIKRNYKDKAVQWWKEYSGAITVIICGIMFIGAMWFFFWRSGKMLDQMAPISENFKIASENMIRAVQNSQNLNSGVVAG